jgi:beta-lactamase regulating signal transducer with metallopeptidase domain
MSAMPADLFMPIIVDLLIKATLVIGLTLALRAAAARWLSASGRHLMTLLAVVMLLALPLFAALLPRWAPPAPAAITALSITTDDATVSHTFEDDQTAVAPPAQTATAVVDAPVVSRMPWGVLLFGVQVIGTALMFIHLGLQRWRVHQLGRAAMVVTDPSWLALLDACARTLVVHRAVRLLRSRSATMPMTFGTMRPAILLPATADTWDEERRRAVLLHELAHVARFDCLSQWAACAMRAVYWMHPGAWWLVSRLRLDREFACDDLVLAAGARPAEYASHLLDIAYTFGGDRAPALAVRMARRSQIEGRLRALLDDSRTRREPSRQARVATAIGAFAVLLPIASVTSPASPAADQRGLTPGGVTVYAEEAPATLLSSSTPHAHAVVVHTAETTPTASRPHVDRTAVARPVAAAHASVDQAAAADVEGCTWEVRRSKGDDDSLQLSMRHGRSQHGRSVPLASLEGLTSAQLASGGTVRFQVRRDAGTFAFEGTARDGVAGGVCSFTASPTFGAELAKRGISGLTAADQQEMARHDVGLALVDELKGQKYATPTVADLVKAGQHGVRVEYVRGMGALGYATGTLEPLITLRDHGVTPDYARTLASFGYAKLPVEQLQRARDHGVTADYLQGMKEGGFGGLSLDEMIKARDHGVTATYVKDMKALGITGSLAELVTARDHGITPNYVRRLTELGYRNLPLDRLQRLRDHGVSPDYVSQVQALGYKSLTPDELVTLRDHGVTPDRIRQANAKAGTQLSVSDLRNAASHGWR